MKTGLKSSQPGDRGKGRRGRTPSRVSTHRKAKKKKIAVAQEWAVAKKSQQGDGEFPALLSVRRPKFLLLIHVVLMVRRLRLWLANIAFFMLWCFTKGG